MTQQQTLYNSASHTCNRVVDPGPLLCESGNTTKRQISSPISSVTPQDRRLSLFLFMCRWTCSRCWHLAERLGHFSDWFDQNDVSVVLVGHGEYLAPAKRFAATMDIPYRVISDDHSMLKRIFGINLYDGSIHLNPVVITDQKGRVCLWRGIKEYCDGRYVDGVIKAIECLNLV